MADLLPDRVELDDVTELIAAANATLVWARTADDPDELWNVCRQADALRRYVRDKDARKALSKAAIGVLVEVGRALGPSPGPGRPPRNSSRAMNLIPQPRAFEARLLAEWVYDRLDPDVREAVDNGWPVKAVLRLIAERTPIVPVAGDDTRELPDDEHPWYVRSGDFRAVTDDIADRSVDLIVTDPPYPTEHLGLFGDLAEWAARVLHPRGLLICLTGKIHLPQVFEHLGRHLTYGWTFLLDMPGGNSSRILGRHVMQTWKPVLLYSTGTWPAQAWRQDRVTSPAPDQSEFGWGQAVAPMAELIESYSRPNALVVDPFCGGGAYGVAALLAGRRFLGVEIDAMQADRARTRIARQEEP